MLPSDRDFVAIRLGTDHVPRPPPDAVDLVSRLLVIPPLCLLANCLWMKQRTRIQPATCCAIVAAGLRGAIAFALAKTVSSYHRRNIATATTGVVLATTFALGGLTRPLLTRLGLVPSADENVRERIKARDDAAREDAEVEQTQKEAANERRAGRSRLLPGPQARMRRAMQRLAFYMRHLDADVLRPTFIASEAIEPLFLMPYGTPRSSAAVPSKEGSAELAVTDDPTANGVQLAPLEPKGVKKDEALQAFDLSRVPQCKAKVAPQEGVERV